MGWQAVGLTKRLRKLGRHRYITSDAAVGNAVRNHLKKVAKKKRSQHERSAKVANVAPEHRGTVWEDMNARNGKMSKRKLAAGQFRRNGDNPLGLCCAEVDLTVHPAGVSAGMPSLPPSAGGRVVAIPRFVIYTGGLLMGRISKWESLLEKIDTMRFAEPMALKQLAWGAHRSHNNQLLSECVPPRPPLASCGLSRISVRHSARWRLPPACPRLLIISLGLPYANLFSLLRFFPASPRSSVSCFS